MVNEVINSLNLKIGQVIVDCTIGTGGHAKEILRRIGREGRLIGIDRDLESLNVSAEQLKEFQDRLIPIHDDFRNLDKILERLNITGIDGILLDLGLSSYQLENPERGFSIKLNGPLDMRMDRSTNISAYDLINSLSKEEISSILKLFGEERFHNRIAHVLVNERLHSPISTTKELSDVVLGTIPYRYQSKNIHPATRTFQAFRIAVNRELEALEIVLEKGVSYLKQGARICVISFHSLEDRIVKESFHKFARYKLIKIFNKKPLRPSFDELKQNPRARSAKLRAGEKL